VAAAVVTLFSAGFAGAEPDAPRSCTLLNPDGSATTFTASVDVASTGSSTIFTYFLDTPGANPDHAALSMDCVSQCAESACSITGGGCSDNTDCPGGNEDICLSDSECLLAYGSPDNNGSSFNGCGQGDLTGLGDLEFSRSTVTANPDQDTSSFFVEIRGQVTCDSGDLAIKNGKRVTSCAICAPLTSLDSGPGAFANTEKIVTLGNCRFSRVFEAETGKLVSSEVLGTADPDGPPCEGIVVSTANGQLISKTAGEGPIGPMPFSQFQFSVQGGPDGLEDFGLGLQDQRGGNEWTSGSGTCVTLSDGFGGTSLACTCQKPLSKGELTYCR
jgi:hypothetical protein